MLNGSSTCTLKYVLKIESKGEFKIYFSDKIINVMISVNEWKLKAW